MSKETQTQNEILAKAGVHFAFNKKRRHPSSKPFLIEGKNRNDIFDLTKTEEMLKNAKDFARDLSRSGKVILFVGAKPEARSVVEKIATLIDMPSVTYRWIGGTLTNFGEIRTRVSRLEELQDKKEKGELSIYTKKERLLIQKEIEKLSKNFSGLVSMKKIPDALFVVDPKKEYSAVLEAKRVGIPVIAMLNSDCNFNEIDYPIASNDTSISSINTIVEEIAESIRGAKKLG